ncbi:MAG: GIY-YIG nuclease family protein [Acidimicrobiales bacterium]
MRSYSLTIDFEWMPHGTVTADADTIRFEPAPRAPGLYRIDLDVTHTYIGEARSLDGRLKGYRKPGGTVGTVVPRTNRRVQRKILEALAASRTVSVWTCTAATLTVARNAIPLPLDDKTHRLLVEAAAMILAERDGWTLENLHRR